MSSNDAMTSAMADMAAAETLEEINRVLYRYAGGGWSRLTIAEIQRLHRAADLRRKEVMYHDRDTLL